MKLGQYNFDVEVVKSKENHADVLSRCPATFSINNQTPVDTDKSPANTAVVGTIIVTPEEIICRNARLTPVELNEATVDDPQLQKVVKALEENNGWNTEIADSSSLRPSCYASTTSS